MTVSRDKASQKSQLDKFKEAARKLECDDDEQHFKERLRKLAAKKTEGASNDGRKGR